MVIKKGSYIAKVCKRTSTGEALIIRFPKQLGKVNDVFQVYVKKLDNENS